MDHATMEAPWNRYGDCWTDRGQAERREVLYGIMREGCIVSSPAAEEPGADALLLRIEQFQKDVPGGYFRTDRFLSHHGQSLADLTMCVADGKALLTGSTLAVFGDDGRIARLTASGRFSF